MPDTPEQIFSRYLERLAEIRSTGGATNETSYYSALERLLNDIGATLRPQVICNGQLRNQGAGHPDFGLYSRRQTTRGQPRQGQGEIPERGVVEVKGLNVSTWQTANSRQVTTYFDRYRLVLVTNYRDFRLIGEDHDGRPAQREFFSLAPDANTFWAAARRSHELVTTQAARFAEFLRRVLLNVAPLSRPEDVAWFLASYARDGWKCWKSVMRTRSTHCVRRWKQQVARIARSAIRGIYRWTFIGVIPDFAPLNPGDAC